MKLIVARHGKTTYNLKHLISGRKDVPLAQPGIEHGENLAKAMQDFPLDAIYSSPLSRALNTAQPTANNQGLDIIVDLRLIEMDFGLIDGRFIKDPEVKMHFDKRMADLNYILPGGECYNQVLERVTDHLNDITTCNYDLVLDIAHFGLNRALLSATTNVPLKKMKNLKPTNEIIYIIDLQKGDCDWINTKTRETGQSLLFKEE